MRHLSSPSQGNFLHFLTLPSLSITLELLVSPPFQHSRNIVEFSPKFLSSLQCQGPLPHLTRSPSHMGCMVYILLSVVGAVSSQAHPPHPTALPSLLLCLPLFLVLLLSFSLLFQFLFDGPGPSPCTFSKHTAPSLPKTSAHHSELNSALIQHGGSLLGSSLRDLVSSVSKIEHRINPSNLTLFQ